MAAPRIADTGIEVVPVELTDGTGGTITGGLVGAADGFASGVRTLPIYSLGYNGTTWDRVRTPSFFKTINLTAATTETTLWTPTSGKRFRLMGFIFTTNSAADLTFNDGTGGPAIFFYNSGTTPVASPPLGNGISSSAADRLLTVVRSVSVTLKGTIWGTEES